MLGGGAADGHPSAQLAAGTPDQSTDASVMGLLTIVRTSRHPPPSTTQSPSEHPDAWSPNATKQGAKGAGAGRDGAGSGARDARPETHRGPGIRGNI